jgi:hypothetical protein
MATPESRKLRAGMLVLAVLGAALMLPPLVSVFNQKLVHFGIPQIVLYLFGLWLALIAGTAWLNRALGANTSDQDEP